MAGDVNVKNIKRKQQQVLTAFSISYVCLGMEYGFSLLTVYYYLKDLLRYEQYEINIFYSAISLAYYLSSMLSSNVAGWLMDNYQCTRLVMFLCHVYVIIGNIAYSLPIIGVYSPYMLLVGRFLAGCGGGLRPLVSTVVDTRFEENERSNAFIVTSIALGIGYVLAPLVNFLFRNVDIRVGLWRIMYMNTPAVVMSWLFLFAMIFGLFMISDLDQKKQPSKTDEDDDNKDEDDVGKYLNQDITLESTDIDMTHSNEELDEANKKEPLTSKHSSESGEESIKASEEFSFMDKTKVVASIICEVDPLLILTVTFLMKSVILLVDMWLPMLVADTLKEDINVLNIIHVFSAVFGLLALLYLCFKPPKMMVAYMISLASLVLVIIMLLIFAIIKVNPNIRVANIVSLIVFAISHAIVLVFGQVFLMYSLFAMVPAAFRSTAEQIRQNVAGLAAILGLVFAPALFEYASEVSIGLIAATFVVIIYFTVRHKDLRAPGGFMSI